MFGHEEITETMQFWIVKDDPLVITVLDIMPLGN